jgi:GlpG protein
MRQAGTIGSESQARRFGDYLLTLGIAAQVDEEPDGWAVWIRDENHLDDAKEQLSRFLMDPDNPRYRDAAGKASDIRREATRKADQARKNIVDIRGRWDRVSARRAPLTFTAIAVCVGVFILTNMGDPNSWWMQKLEFVEFHQEDPDIDPVGNRWDRLVDIRNGQVWRIISPNYLHLGILHLVFNMYWLYRFGGDIESRKGSFFLLLMLVVIGVGSNVAQALIESPFGGGMSGVVYGLFGYVWMKSAYDPGSGFHMPGYTVVVFIIWFFACFTGFLGNIANTAHGAGLVIGVVWGYAPVLWETVRKRG